MAMEVSKEVAGLFFVLTGERFPDANEDHLRALAEEWRTAAGGLRQLEAGLRAAVTYTRSTFDGGAERAFADRMAKWVEGAGIGSVPSGQVPSNAGGARGRGGGGSTGGEISAGPGGNGMLSSMAFLFDSLADFLDKLAEDVEYVKLVIIYQLTLLLAEIALAYALSPFTGGLVWGYLKVKFVIVKRLMDHLLGMLLLQFAVAWVIGSAFQLLVDMLAQSTQFGMGTRDDWNEEHTRTAAEVGAVGAGISLLLGPLHLPISRGVNSVLTSMFDKKFDDFGTNFAIILGGGLHESLTDMTYTGMKEHKFSDTWYGALTAGMASGAANVLGEFLFKIAPYTDFDFKAWVDRHTNPRGPLTPDVTSPLIADVDTPDVDDPVTGGPRPPNGPSPSEGPLLDDLSDGPVFSDDPPDDAFPDGSAPPDPFLEDSFFDDSDTRGPSPDGPTPPPVGGHIEHGGPVFDDGPIANDAWWDQAITPEGEVWPDEEAPPRSSGPEFWELPASTDSNGTVTTGDNGVTQPATAPDRPNTGGEQPVVTRGEQPMDTRAEQPIVVRGEQPFVPETTRPDPGDGSVQQPVLSHVDGPLPDSTRGEPDGRGAPNDTAPNDGRPRLTIDTSMASSVPHTMSESPVSPLTDDERAAAPVGPVSPISPAPPVPQADPGLDMPTSTLEPTPTPPPPPHIAATQSPPIGDASTPAGRSWDDLVNDATGPHNPDRPQHMAALRDIERVLHRDPAYRDSADSIKQNLVDEYFHAFPAGTAPRGESHGQSGIVRRDTPEQRRAWDVRRNAAKPTRVSMERFMPASGPEVAGGQVAGKIQQIRADLRHFEVEPGKWVFEFTVPWDFLSPDGRLDAESLQQYAREIQQGLDESANFQDTWTKKDEFHGSQLHFTVEVATPHGSTPDWDADPNANVPVEVRDSATSDPSGQAVNQVRLDRSGPVQDALHEFHHYLGLGEGRFVPGLLFNPPVARGGIMGDRHLVDPRPTPGQLDQIMSLPRHARPVVSHSLDESADPAPAPVVTHGPVGGTQLAGPYAGLHAPPAAPGRDQPMSEKAAGKQPVRGQPSAVDRQQARARQQLALWQQAEQRRAAQQRQLPGQATDTERLSDLDDLARSWVDARIEFEARSQVFERRLADYLMRQPKVAAEVERFARAVWANVPQEWRSQVGEDDRLLAGAVGMGEANSQGVVDDGNLRERITLLWSIARGDALLGELPSLHDRHPAIESERVQRRRTPADADWMSAQKDDTLSPEERKRRITEAEAAMRTSLTPTTVHPPLSDREQRIAVQDGELSWAPAERRMEMTLDGNLHRSAEDTGGLVTTGTSGSAYLVMHLAQLANERWNAGLDLPTLRLGVLGFMLGTNQHTYHEVMRATALNDPSLGYVDDWNRYRFLHPLTEDELRANVAVDGLFPNEYAEAKVDWYAGMDSLPPPQEPVHRQDSPELYSASPASSGRGSESEADRDPFYLDRIPPQPERQVRFADEVEVREFSSGVEDPDSTDSSEADPFYLDVEARQVLPREESPDSTDSSEADPFYLDRILPQPESQVRFADEVEVRVISPRAESPVRQEVESGGRGSAATPPEKTTIRFARRRTTLDEAGFQQTRQLAFDLFRMMLDDHRAGRPMPRVAVVGYGNSFTHARATGEARARAVLGVLGAYLRAEYARYRQLGYDAAKLPDVSSVLPRPFSGGRSRNPRAEGPDRRTRRRSVVVDISQLDDKLNPSGRPTDYQYVTDLTLGIAPSRAGRAVDESQNVVDTESSSAAENELDLDAMRARLEALKSDGPSEGPETAADQVPWTPERLRDRAAEVGPELDRLRAELSPGEMFGLTTRARQQLAYAHDFTRLVNLNLVDSLTDVTAHILTTEGPEAARQFAADSARDLGTTRTTPMLRGGAGPEPARPLAEALERQVVPNPDVPHDLLGPDLFGLLTPAAPPNFLAGLDISRLSTAQLPALFEKLDLTQPTPDGITAESLGHRADQVITHERRAETRTDWAPGAVPPLRETLEMPKLLHTIWLGGPVTDSGSTAVVRQKFGAAADKYVNRVTREATGTSVVWTDVPRSAFESARTTPPPADGGPDPHADVRDMMNWAKEHNIRVVNIDEVFHRDFPMRLHPFYRSEVTKQVGRGWAAGSDISRFEILRAFGGVYTDGDNDVHDLALAEDVVHSTEAWAVLHTSARRGNAAFAMPRDHPIADLALSGMADKYDLPQGELYNQDVATMNKEFFDTDAMRTRRHSLTYRVGPEFVFTTLLPSLGYDPERPPMVGAVTMNSARSWLPGADTERPPVSDPVETVELTKKVVQTLVRELRNRQGDLHLTAVAEAVNRHEDPDRVWSSALRFIAARPELAGQVRTVTTHRWEGGRYLEVSLPSSLSDVLVISPVHGEQRLGEYAWPAGMFGSGAPRSADIQPDPATGTLTDAATTELIWLVDMVGTVTAREQAAGRPVPELVLVADDPVVVLAAQVMQTHLNELGDLPEGTPFAAPELGVRDPEPGADASAEFTPPSNQRGASESLTGLAGSGDHGGAHWGTPPSRSAQPPMPAGPPRSTPPPAGWIQVRSAAGDRSYYVHPDDVVRNPVENKSGHLIGITFVSPADPVYQSDREWAESTDVHNRYVRTLPGEGHIARALYSGRNDAIVHAPWWGDYVAGGTGPIFLMAHGHPDSITVHVRSGAEVWHNGQFVRGHQEWEGAVDGATAWHLLRSIRLFVDLLDAKRDASIAAIVCEVAEGAFAPEFMAAMRRDGYGFGRRGHFGRGYVHARAASFGTFVGTNYNAGFDTYHAFLDANGEIFRERALGTTYDDSEIAAHNSTNSRQGPTPLDFPAYGHGSTHDRYPVQSVSHHSSSYANTRLPDLTGQRSEWAAPPPDWIKVKSNDDGRTFYVHPNEVVRNEVRNRAGDLMGITFVSSADPVYQSDKFWAESADVHDKYIRTLPDESNIADAYNSGRPDAVVDSPWAGDYRNGGTGPIFVIAYGFPNSIATRIRPGALVWHEGQFWNSLNEWRAELDAAATWKLLRSMQPFVDLWNAKPDASIVAVMCDVGDGAYAAEFVNAMRRDGFVRRAHFGRKLAYVFAADGSGSNTFVSASHNAGFYTYFEYSDANGNVHREIAPGTTYDDDEIAAHS